MTRLDSLDLTLRHIIEPMLVVMLPSHACGHPMETRIMHDGPRLLQYQLDRDAYEAVIVSKCHYCMDATRAPSQFHHENCLYYGKVEFPGSIMAYKEMRIMVSIIVDQIRYVLLDMANLIKSHYSPLDAFLATWAWDAETGKEPL